MGIITRYIVWELFKVFAVTLTAMTLLMIIVGAAHEAILQGLGPGPIVRLIPYLLPNALRFSIPGTILFAVCSVYGRMSAWNEVTAVRSMGISVLRLLWPALALGLVLSLLTVWMNDVAVTWGREGVHRVVIQSVEEIAYGMLRTQRSYSTNDFSINVQSVEGKKLVRPTVVFYAKEGSPAVTLTAEEAELICDLKRNVLTIELFSGTVEAEGKAVFDFPDTFRHEVPLSLATNKDDDSDGPSHLPMTEIGPQIEAQKAEISQLEQALSAEAACDMILGDFAALDGPHWQEKREPLKAAGERLHRLETEPWRRWATGFSCFFFVLVGAPLAIRLRNSDLWTSFAICFLPILLVYYPLLAYGVDRAKTGALPPYVVWGGNAILLLAGLWLLRRAVRR